MQLTITVLSCDIRPLSLKSVLLMGNLDPFLIHGSLGPPESSSKWHVDLFNRFCTAGRVSLYFTMGCHSPPKIAHSPRESAPHLTHGSFGPPASPPKQHLDQFSRFCKDHERDQQTTDSPTTKQHGTPWPLFYSD